MHDDLIAALERAVELCDEEAARWLGTVHKHLVFKCRADAVTIRALIADLRAGNLVRREDVVAQERVHYKRGYGPGDGNSAIAAGAHEGGGR